MNQVVNEYIDTLDIPVDQCTHLEWSCGVEVMMPNLTKEQKQVIKSLYKNGEKVISSELRIDFLTQTLEGNFVTSCVIYSFILVQHNYFYTCQSHLLVS